MINGPTERVQSGSPSVPHLLIVTRDGRWSSRSLPSSGALIIGRGDEVDIHVNDQEVSRRHARLETGAVGNLWLVDLNSANGTWVNGQLVRDGSVTVRSGEPIQMGQTLFSVHGVPPARTQELPQQPPLQGHAMAKVDRLIRKAALAPMDVLLLGETGVGKGVAAERIHYLSGRKGKLIQLNCAGLTAALLETQLFGHVRGAFTGAIQSKPGVLEVAKGGTVFLDEVGEMPLEVQAKLLVAIEKRDILPVGATETLPIDVRFIYATHRDLQEEIRTGRFRDDLYYRVNAFAIAIPPLRDRRDEIDSLISHFTSELAMKLNRNRFPVFREDALTMLRCHDWPGNIRQLRTIVQSAILFADDNNTVTLDSLASAGLPIPGAPLLSPPPPCSPSSSPSCEAAKELSREHVLEALAATAWNQTRVAKLLGIPRNKLIRLMERYNIPRPRAQCDSDHRKDGLL